MTCCFAGKISSSTVEEIPMGHHDLPLRAKSNAHCCPCCDESAARFLDVTRRAFLGGVGAATMGGSLLTGLSWSALASGGEPLPEQAPARRPLKVTPILVYSTPERRNQSSWRHWGGIQTENDAKDEVTRIGRELEELKNRAEYPIEFAPVAKVRTKADLDQITDLSQADTFLVYAAGGWMDVLDTLGAMNKDIIIFCRHKSGPVYLWYEIISPRYLRQHTDKRAVQHVDEQDVVIDNQDELLWRLRSLCGLHNTKGFRIVAIGGAGAWAQPRGVVPDLVKEKWNWDIQVVEYAQLAKLLEEARGEAETLDRMRKQADEYLELPGTRLETERSYLENSFLLTEVFRRIMQKANCRALTIEGCMGTVMPIAETTACIPLSLLNDAGYLAFCESDFVVVPAGVLLANISGCPAFLNDPTYPHDQVITLAHCTAPRKMDGKNVEPARILTHFESDYGAAPKVDMRIGQVVTNIIPDFAAQRYVGLLAEIVENPFLPICRSQIDVRYKCTDQELAQEMPGFHWITGYGDYTKELAYALKKVGIEWNQLG
jgi:hypothetical protein